LRRFLARVSGTVRSPVVFPGRFAAGAFVFRAISRPPFAVIVAGPLVPAVVLVTGSLLVPLSVVVPGLLALVAGTFVPRTFVFRAPLGSTRFVPAVLAASALAAGVPLSAFPLEMFLAAAFEPVAVNVRLLDQLDFHPNESEKAEQSRPLLAQDFDVHLVPPEAEFFQSLEDGLFGGLSRGEPFMGAHRTTAF
jgi:hypothetical protein